MGEADSRVYGNGYPDRFGCCLVLVRSQEVRERRRTGAEEVMRKLFDGIVSAFLAAVMLGIALVQLKLKQVGG